ncbi:hypothetical protein NCC49_006384 [Naganishia albida]|nr:hypothetical protein NCC49_006384 [Naganishia albida]
MSDSEDDFMSDKYLVAAEATTRKSTQTYAQRRAHAAAEAEKRHLESRIKPRAVREEEARRKALETSLFERKEAQSVGAGKAMGMMMKMGWKVGEGLGKRSEPSTMTATTTTTTGVSGAKETSDVSSDEDTPRGIGAPSKKRKLAHPSTTPARTEPIRLSLWTGKSGLGAHQRSPEPEDMSFLLRQAGTGRPASTATTTGPGKELDLEADAFRRRRGEKEDAKRTEGREWAARGLLMEFDQAKGVPFHPLWIIPSSALQTIPRPLLRLIDPQAADDLASEDEEDQLHAIRGRPEEENVSAADAMRAAMKRDALVDLSEEPGEPVLRAKVTTEADKVPEPEVDWRSYLPGVQRVLHMSPAEHLAFLVDSLRVEHLYCFWCAAKYASVQEMEGPGGCPGTEEDDH